MLRFQVKEYRELDNDKEIANCYEVNNQEIAEYAGIEQSKHSITVVVDDIKEGTRKIYRKGKRVE